MSPEIDAKMVKSILRQFWIKYDSASSLQCFNWNSDLLSYHIHHYHYRCEAPDAFYDINEPGDDTLVAPGCCPTFKSKA